MKAEILINERVIGQGRPVYVIAELSANHHRDFAQAVRLVEAAKSANADAVKVQTYTADTMTINSDAPSFRITGGTLWDGQTLYELYRRASMPWDWQPRLKAVADRLGLDFFSTPFDASAVEFLETLQVPAYKIASFEVVDLALLKRIAQTGKPVILSTGMASLAEIEEAVAALRAAGTQQLALLKCTSAYPAPPEAMNLRTIPDLAGRFDLPVGLSDHTLGASVAVAAVAMGACIIEKHLTLSRATPGPDSAFSAEPDEFKAMVEAVHTAARALGRVSYDVTEQEAPSLRFRRSLFVVEDMKRGEAFTEKTVRCIRPGHGLHPRHLPDVLGRAAAHDIPRGTPLTWELVK